MKPKSPDVPDAPTYQEDPRFAELLNMLKGLGTNLTSFNFTGGMAPLQETIDTSPEMTRLFLQGLKAQLDPWYRDIRRGTINELAATNQLQSSVLPNRLLQSETDLQNLIIGQTSQFGIADINRAMTNRVALFGAGLNTLSGAAGMAGGMQGQLNQFNLANYENIVAQILGNAKPQRGGLLGGLTGAAGGGLAGLGIGLGLAPFTGGLSMWPALIGALGGGLLGGFGQSGTGGNLLNMGAGLTGANLRSLPGSTASNNPFDWEKYNAGIEKILTKNPFKGLSLGTT